MSTNSIFVPYTGLRSTANAVGAYVKDWKSVAQFSFAPEDLMKPGFIGSAVAVYRNAKHCEINGEKVIVGGVSDGHQVMFFNAFVGIDGDGQIKTIIGDDNDHVMMGFSGSKIRRVCPCKGVIPDMSYSEFKEALSSKQTSKMPRRIADGILLQTVSNTVYWICPGEVEVQQDNDDGTGWF